MTASSINTFIDNQYKITYPRTKEPTTAKRLSVVHIASYISIGTMTLVTISALFCLFLFVKLVDDCVRFVSPVRLLTFTKNQIDWTAIVDILSNQLTHFAEWEKSKRSFWYSPQNPIDHEDKFQDLISTVTAFMNNYVHQRKQRQQDKTL